jgi:hypothetical protein
MLSLGMPGDRVNVFLRERCDKFALRHAWSDNGQIIATDNCKYFKSSSIFLPHTHNNCRIEYQRYVCFISRTMCKQCIDTHFFMQNCACFLPRTHTFGARSESQRATLETFAQNMAQAIAADEAMNL